MQSKTKVIVSAVVVALALGLGYSGGRYAQPARVVYQEKVVTVEKERIVTKVDTDRILNALATLHKQNDVHTVKVIEKAADGSTKVTVTQDDKSKTDSKSETQEKTKEVQIQTVERLVYQTKEITKITERARPNWALSLQPGYDFAGALGHGNSYNLLPSLPFQHIVLGLAIEKRLIGPLYTGLWANSSGAGGISLRLEF